MTNAWQFVIDNKGISSGAAYPYTSGNGAVGTCQNDRGIAFSAVSGYRYAVQNSASALMGAIDLQPIAVAVDATALQNYVSGILDSEATCTTNVNHGVLAVGYDTTPSEDAPNGYYIVKNSWDTWWGENGYFRIAITGNDAGICGIQQYGMYPY